MITSTTGSSIETYFDWIKEEIEGKKYGEVSITFLISDKQIVNVRRGSVDTDRFIPSNSAT